MIDLKYIWVLISINRYILNTIQDEKTRKSLKSKCITNIKIQNQQFFEFSHQSVLSNLYYGIDAIETAIQSHHSEERSFNLKTSEQMLQVPAMLDEDDFTASIPNRYLVCCSYFYLSVVRKLQGDEWQAAVHFLQAVLVSPRVVWNEFAPELCESLFKKCENRSLEFVACLDSEEEIHEVVVKEKARRYKECLVYYQVMLYGEIPWWSSYCSSNSANYSCVSSTSVHHEPRLKTCNTYEKIHPMDPQDRIQEKLDTTNIIKLDSSMFTRSIEDVALSISKRIEKTSIDLNCRVEDLLIEEALQPLEFHLFDHASSRLRLGLKNHEESSNMKLQTSLGKYGEEYIVNTASIFESLIGSSGTNYGSLKDVILDELLIVISTSKEEKELRASVSILTTIVSRNKSIIEDVKKKGLRLCDLASALKQNVYEAAILIYLINPSPIDIKTLELLPIFVEIVCTSSKSCYKRNKQEESLLMTPHAASLMIIEELVTSFDYATNNMHLEAISSPHFLSGLLEVARNDNLEEFFSLTTILIKCMQFDSQCRKYVSKFTPLAPFLHLLDAENIRAKCMALEYFHEILCIPRSSAINLLQRIKKESRMDIMQILMHCTLQLQPDHQILAANVLIQLDTLNPTDKSLFREEAVEILLRALTSEESSEQILSASILSNLAGTYTWTGESYTAAWFLRKTGLNSPYHQNMIRNFNWLDQSLQDTSIDVWCSKIAKCIISVGDSIFYALDKGLRSKMKKVSRDCLVTISWLGCQISKNPDSLSNSTSEIILRGVEQFLHPGMELDERLLACMCMFNYASGKGKQKLMHFSEGVKESLRRLSIITWMAEELHRVADFLLPNTSRISCVHTQILEVGRNFSISVCSLIYYKGLLFSGYSDGSIKVWDIRGHSASLVWDIKEHKKSVTCFSIYEPLDSLLSGSTDKTIRVWKMIQRNLECLEVIVMKEPIHHLRAHGETIFSITERQGIKVVNKSREIRDIFKGKHGKCMIVAQGKLYTGCTDSSIQEYNTTHNRELEIKPPTRSWRKQSKPINSIVAYRDWLYSASKHVEGTTFKEWKRSGKPKISILTDKGDNVVAMEVVEDFLYLISSSSTSSIQIWLRGVPKKLGRISAGSKITSIYAANDIIFCGTEKGLIKGWIPL
ncbi:putative E3 ubiquitin-protein ligase LIN-1 isoform X2 [Lathyrus oleraceus]|uniref:putative E3 ubiquitin-protein ligase LIN-1 isoform X2 n=1 Tax=Pisum sativum TaxID=3888 RepID=UPI0021D1530B|nr:putative E3 ubiquitin-protein ligase LIN-1 isoform X2 [Pisum sativum]